MQKLSLLLILLVAGCAMAPPPEPMPPIVPSPSGWSTTLSANPGFEGARGGVEARSNASGTAVTIAYGEIPGATGTVRPWHIHYGRCGNDRGIVGNPNAYSALRLGSGGTATTSATITVPLTAGNEYFINVHRSPTDTQTIVACGQLTQTM